MRQTLLDLFVLQNSSILNIQCYKKTSTENMIALVTTVNYGSAMHPHMVDQTVCQFVFLKKNMPFNYIKHKHGTAICWHDLQTHYDLTSSHLADAHTHSSLPTRSQKRKKNLRFKTWLLTRTHNPIRLFFYNLIKPLFGAPH